jgi:hypothetical protein
MIRTLLVVAAVVLVTACGPAWEGTYNGTFSWTETCSDGINTSEATPVEWKLTENGGVLTISPLTGTCGSFTADIDGANATLRAKSCPSFTSGGFTYVPQLTGGTVSVKDERLTGLMTFFTNFSGNYSGTCNATGGIDLIRTGD